MDSLNQSRILNQLVHAERRSLISRLMEAATFVSRASTDLLEALSGMIQQEQEHVSWLIDLIVDLGESPTPSTADVNTTSLHYVELDYLMPRAIEDKRNLIRFYESAAPQLAAGFEAPEIINQIITRHKTHLATLQEMSREH